MHTVFFDVVSGTMTVFILAGLCFPLSRRKKVWSKSQDVTLNQILALRLTSFTSFLLLPLPFLDAVEGGRSGRAITISLGPSRATAIETCS